MSSVKKLFIVLALAFLNCMSAFAQDQKSRLCEPWQNVYTGDDAKGDLVIALWQFAAGAELQDSSGKSATHYMRVPMPTQKTRGM